MIGGLESALYLAKMGQLKHTDKNEKLQSVIVFLTDGDPNIGIGPPEEIIELVSIYYLLIILLLLCSIPKFRNFNHRTMSLF